MNKRKKPTIREVYGEFVGESEMRKEFLELAERYQADEKTDAFVMFVCLGLAIMGNVASVIIQSTQLSMCMFPCLALGLYFNLSSRINRQAKQYYLDQVMYSAYHEGMERGLMEVGKCLKRK